MRLTNDNFDTLRILFHAVIDKEVVDLLLDTQTNTLIIAESDCEIDDDHVMVMTFENATRIITMLNYIGMVNSNLYVKSEFVLYMTETYLPNILTTLEMNFKHDEAF